MNAPPEPAVPLNSAHFDALQSAQRSVNTAASILKKMNDAGMDTTAHDAYTEATRQKLDKIVNTFFPNGRPK